MIQKIGRVIVAAKSSIMAFSLIILYVLSFAISSKIKSTFKQSMYPYIFQMRNIDRTKQISAIPDILKPIIHRIEHLDVISEIDQLTVNVYPPGTGLGSHIDTHSAFTGIV